LCLIDFKSVKYLKMGIALELTPLIPLRECPTGHGQVFFWKNRKYLAKAEEREVLESYL
jgi:hypothetical protein